MKSKLSLLIPGALVVLGGASCAAPKNPAVVDEPAWPSQEVEQLARRACFDCHSNETKWPLYTSLPVVGDLVRHDVFEGREALNFSEWGRPQEESDELGEVVREGEMPLGIYLPFHPEANLSDEERETLARGLEQLVAADPPPGERED